MHPLLLFSILLQVYGVIFLLIPGMMLPLYKLPPEPDTINIARYPVVERRDSIRTNPSAD
jgi:hypothetical protein